MFTTLMIISVPLVLLVIEFHFRGAQKLEMARVVRKIDPLISEVITEGTSPILVKQFHLDYRLWKQADESLEGLGFLCSKYRHEFRAAALKS